MTPPASVLTWSTAHLRRTDERDDLTPDPETPVPLSNPNWPQDTTLPPDLPEQLVFAANFGHVTYTHYPDSGTGWPIMSRAMLHTLLTVGPFPHRTVPVRIYDPVVYRRDPDPDEHFRARRLETADDRFVVVQLTTHLDVLDEAASGVRRDPDLPWWVDVDRYAFLPGVTLPPLFRVVTDPAVLFVSRAARRALAAANLTGPVYRPIDGDLTQEVADIPVPEPELNEGA